MTPKEEIIDKIQALIREEGKKLQDDTKTPITEKLIKADVLLDTMKFLNNYDKNIEILNQHIKNNKWKEGNNGR